MGCKIGKSGYRGVYWNKHRNKWQARIYVEGGKKHVGYYDDPYQAHLAYQEAKRSMVQRKSIFGAPGSVIRKWAKANESGEAMSMTVTVPLVLDAVSYCFGVPDDELISLRRAGDIAEARQFVYYILWRSGVSLSHIGRLLGRHHASVIHGIQKTKERLATEDGRYAYTCILACMYDQSWRVAS